MDGLSRMPLWQKALLCVLMVTVGPFYWAYHMLGVLWRKIRGRPLRIPMPDVDPDLIE